MAIKKITKQISFQRKLIMIENEGTENEEIITNIPEDRVIIRYVEGEESELEIGNAIKETINVNEPSILIKADDLSSGNPEGYDLAKVGAEELLNALLAKLDEKINA